MSRRLLLSYLTVTLIVLAVLEVPLGVTYSHNERRDLETKVERTPSRSRPFRGCAGAIG